MCDVRVVEQLLRLEERKCALVEAGCGWCRKRSEGKERRASVWPQVPGGWPVMRTHFVRGERARGAPGRACLIEEAGLRHSHLAGNNLSLHSPEVPAENTLNAQEAAAAAARRASRAMFPQGHLEALVVMGKRVTSVEVETWPALLEHLPPFRREPDEAASVREREPASWHSLAYSDNRMTVAASAALRSSRCGHAPRLEGSVRQQP